MVFNRKKYEGAFRWQYGAYPFFTSVYTLAAAPQKNKYYLCWKDFLNFFKEDNLTAFLPRQKLLKIGNNEIQELLKGNDKFYKTFVRLYDEIEAVIKLCQNIKDSDVTKINSWWPKVQKALSHTASVLFPFDYAVDGFMNDLKKKDYAEFVLISNSIISPQPSFIDKARREFLKFRPTDDFKLSYNKFIKKYGWIQNSYVGKFEISEEWFGQFLGEKKNNPQVKSNEKTVADKKLRLFVKTVLLAINFRNQKKKLLLLAVEHMDSWLKYFCHENNLEYKKMLWLTMDEILNNDGIKKSEVYFKNKSRTGLMVPGGYKDASQNQWDLVAADNISTNNQKVLTGLPASSGIYRGIARIILDPRNYKQFNQGDVLVASMTRPDYLPLMQKAGAFVTDEGGITCHAAIVAREMNKPCVTGTRIATKVLKDGDRVDVDANMGIVKILKKYEKRKH